MNPVLLFLGVIGPGFLNQVPTVYPKLDRKRTDVEPYSVESWNRKPAAVTEDTIGVTVLLNRVRTSAESFVTLCVHVLLFFICCVCSVSVLV